VGSVGESYMFPCSTSSQVSVSSLSPSFTLLFNLPLYCFLSLFFHFSHTHTSFIIRDHRSHGLVRSFNLPALISFIPIWFLNDHSFSSFQHISISYLHVVVNRIMPLSKMSTTLYLKHMTMLYHMEKGVCPCLLF
jgi:hypothetical protein